MKTRKNDLRQCVTESYRYERISRRLEEHGIKLLYHKHLDRVSNVTWCWGGHLKDGTCHYTYRWEYSGDTYHIKDILKRYGFRWDAARKCWWRAASDDFSPKDVGEVLCRELASQ